MHAMPEGLNGIKLDLNESDMNDWFLIPRNLWILFEPHSTNFYIFEFKIPLSTLTGFLQLNISYIGFFHFQTKILRQSQCQNLAKNKRNC